MENIRFQPIVIHCTEDQPGNLLTRKNFGLYNIEDYGPDLAASHALVYYGYDASPSYYFNLVDDLIDGEFLTDDFREAAVHYQVDDQAA